MVSSIPRFRVTKTLIFVVKGHGATAKPPIYILIRLDVLGQGARGDRKAPEYTRFNCKNLLIIIFLQTERGMVSSIPRFLFYRNLLFIKGIV